MRKLLSYIWLLAIVSFIGYSAYNVVSLESVKVLLELFGCVLGSVIVMYLTLFAFSEVFFD